MENVSDRKDIVRVPRILLHPSVISIQSGDIIAGVGWCRWMPMDEGTMPQEDECSYIGWNVMCG